MSATPKTKAAALAGALARKEWKAQKALLFSLGFSEIEFDRDGVEWLHSPSGMKIYGTDMGKLKTAADVVKLIYDRGQAVGEAGVQQKMRDALGLNYPGYPW